ncbi:hypothetical protein [Shewanella sp. GD03713]|uniref:hypothetical protein n=1 Tax=Shewanella sp. GD03713 TaxID=2975372 RepID=UPI00244AB223|nr:hypothetical protein [Shewanella sp. GD03713]MDH1472614.1 hypothetical protein [Shewanella sp. GD03713]
MRYEIMEKLKKIDKSKFMRKRDLYTTFAMCGMYALAGLAGGQWGYMFCSLTIFHVGLLYMSMYRNRAFGFDILPLLLPIGGIGWFFYAIGAKTYMSTGLENIIQDNMVAWLFMGITPLFIQRAVHHVLSGRKQ